MKKRFSVVVCTLLLSGCGLFGGSANVETGSGSLDVSGAKSGILSFEMLIKNEQLAPRPAAALAIYVGTFLAEGIFFPTHGATLGVEAQSKIIEGQETPAADETFALLEELGSILQVNVPDLLNRSPDREVTLGQYLDSLKNIYTLGQRKEKELKATADQLDKDERDQRKTANDLQRAINKALDAEDFTGAGSMQQDLATAQAKLAESAVKRKQAKDLGNRYQKLVDVAGKRIVAIESNRKILIAGLKVVDLPGVNELGIVVEPTSQNTVGGGALGADKLR